MSLMTKPRLPHLTRNERRVAPAVHPARSLSPNDTEQGGSADVITPACAGTLDGLFRERVRRTPPATAYRYYERQSASWRDVSWSDMAAEVARWQAGLEREALQPGDRVSIFMRNCKEWVTFDQAAMGLGLVLVPLFFNDRGENIVYILQDAGIKLLLIEGEEQWNVLRDTDTELEDLRRILCLHPVTAAENDLPRQWVGDWLPTESRLRERKGDPHALATIVYTSGTTGRPKGVMLSHYNILWNAYSGLQSIMMYPQDLFLSFLPLSHTLERTAGYYLPIMAGATVAFNRSIPQLADDLVTLRPTTLISVPRIFERIYAKIDAQLKEKSFIARWLFQLAVKVGWKRFLWQQGRGPIGLWRLLWPTLQKLVATKVQARVGGRLRCIICGGAPLSFPVAQTFIALGLPLQQGYGLTETSPVVSVNTFERNDPVSVGPPLKDVEMRIGEDHELLVKSPGVMLGYWNNHKATYNTIDADGWLHTGDQARIENGYIYITGRLKEILVLANGEKVPPADLELAISSDPLFEQVMVVGDAHPYLSALVVLSPEHWAKLAPDLGLDPSTPASLENEELQTTLVKQIDQLLTEFPGYAQVRRVAPMLEPWTVENELLTPTLKLRRKQILEKYAHAIDMLYAGHTVDAN